MGNPLVAQLRDAKLRLFELEAKNQSLEHLAIEFPRLWTEFQDLSEKLASRHRYLDEGLLQIFSLADEPIRVNDLALWRRYSRSQLGQDILALIVSKFKTNGFFVEFGATDGVQLSNTYLLERHYGWSGVLAEPNSTYQINLQSNRSSQIVSKAVWGSSGHTLELAQAAELSTLKPHTNEPFFLQHAKQSGVELVETISLEDLLLSTGCPSMIDFLSIDTEGSEVEILKEFDFSKWRFGLVVVEHNYAHETELDQILGQAGYIRILRDVSLWDAWYVPDSGEVN